MGRFGEESSEAHADIVNARCYEASWASKYEVEGTSWTKEEWSAVSSAADSSGRMGSENWALSQVWHRVRGGHRWRRAISMGQWGPLPGTDPGGNRGEKFEPPNMSNSSECFQGGKRGSTGERIWGK